MRTVFRAELVAAIGSKGGTLARPVTRRWRATAATLTKGSHSLASWLHRLEKAGDPRAAISGRSLASTMPKQIGGCSPSPSQTASWLRPRSRRRRSDVGGLIIIGDIRGEPLAIDVSGEQTLNIGKADQIAQNVAPSPGPAVSSVTSAHDVTR